MAYRFYVVYFSPKYQYEKYWTKFEEFRVNIYIPSIKFPLLCVWVCVYFSTTFSWALLIIDLICNLEKLSFGTLKGGFILLVEVS